VLGSLLSRLFFVVALLLSGIPVFAITQIFGGVAISAITYSFAIAAATAFITGAIAMAIAVFKVGTRRTIFSFYLFITIYIAGLWMLDGLDYFHPVLNNGSLSSTSWFTGIHPFLALRVIFNQKEHIPPDLLSLPAHLQKWPLGWYFSSPHSFYIGFMFFFSFVLVVPGILLLRRMAQSTNSMQSWVLQKLRISKGDKTRKPRTVWSNPIAWREAKTKASAARATVLRYSFMIAGIGGAIALLVMFSRIVEPTQSVALPDSFDQANMLVQILGKDDPPRRITTEFIKFKEPGESQPVTKGLTQLPRGRYQVTSVEYAPNPTGGPPNTLVSMTLAPLERSISAARARQFLLGMIMIEFAVILLIVTNAAASTVTREKEDGSLDLLLATPITSRYYIWGKLRGLVSFVLPLAAIPIASIGLFVVYDIWRMASGQEFDWVVFPEALLILPGTLTIVVAFAAILGMQMSLRCRRTVMAVMSSVGIVMGICVGLALCGYNVVDSRAMSQIGLVFGSFSPFTLVTLLVDPRRYAAEQFGFGGGNPDPSNVAGSRLLTFIFGWAATGAYTLVVWGMYKSMVKNFDMTIRKQSR
jgi:ABC-type transport system involved in multi-copper enzyme maturation permease subunit